MNLITLKTLVSFWILIAQQLTKTNKHSLATFSAITALTSLTVSLQLRRVYDITNFNTFISDYIKSNSNCTETEIAHAFSVYVLTVEMPTLGKDLLRALTTGRFQNTSGFRNKVNSKLPKFMYECFIHIFDRDGYIRENDGDIAALRQMLMMYYKFVVPFSKDQELEAHTKFIETDNRVKTHDFPSSIDEVRKHFLSCLPDNPWDIRPHHSNGATNTSGINNLDKRALVRVEKGLFGMYSTYFRDTDLTFVSDRSTFNSKLTVVPKDSRGPRTICMEPHERMFIQKGIMQKIYDHIESSSPAKGYINFTRQSINQGLAYKASIDASLATIDLKDASDMVSFPLLQQILQETEWIEALTVTRATHVETLIGRHRLNKFAPMGSALCFPIEAILFWSVARTVCPEVYVYGDDIIVPSAFADSVMSELERYGLVINRDKSLTTGFFKESCGGDYYKGHDVGIIQFKSLDATSFVEFVNLLNEKYQCEDLANTLVHKFEHECKFRFPRSECVNELSGFFKTDRLSANSVFFRKRYNDSLQRDEIRVLRPDTVSLNSNDLKSEHLYHDWLNNSIPYSSFEDYRYDRSYDNFLNKSYSSFYDITFDSNIKLVKKRDKLKFTWLPTYLILGM